MIGCDSQFNFKFSIVHNNFILKMKIDLCQVLLALNRLILNFNTLYIMVIRLYNT